MRWWVRKQFLRLKLYVSENCQNEAESLVIWYAVCLAMGSAFYFTLPIELPVWVIITFLEGVLLILYLTRRQNIQFKMWTYVLLFVLGLCVAKVDAIYRAGKVETKIHEITYLRGKVKELDYNSNNRPRILLSEVEDDEQALKGDFRISLMQKVEWLKQGKCVELVAKVPQQYTPNPLSNYNNERVNFYKGISATGYSLTPIFEVDCENNVPFYENFINRIRAYIKSVIDENTTQQQGSIIKALTIGDKSSISETQNANYRTAGLAHFLAISGMHLGMIALMVFFLIRTLLFPLGRGRYDLRKPAAIASLFFSFAYFLISGQSVSCIRAFVMTSIVLLGILLNRRAISLRAWAFAVMVITIITPSAVISAGFLMSFSAVLGLVAFYEKYGKSLQKWLNAQTVIGKMLAYFVGVLITDLVASLMTLPYSIYYFHQISIYTSLGNLLAAPIIAFWVMPAMLLFLVSLPLGLGKATIPLLASGVEKINLITDWVAELPSAKSGEGVGAMPDWSIFILTIGLLWVCIWQEKWRRWGLVGIAVGLIGLHIAPTPDFVFDEAGTTYAYKNNKGKFALAPYHKNRFLAKMWTGSNVPAQSEDNIISCTKEKCIYKERIEFSKEALKLDGKEIELKQGGYINLKRGKVIYYHPEHNRLWNKTKD